jgi:hypothetical protein
MKFVVPGYIFDMSFCNFTYLRGTDELNVVIPALDLSLLSLFLDPPTMINVIEPKI